MYSPHCKLLQIEGTMGMELVQGKLYNLYVHNLHVSVLVRTLKFLRSLLESDLSSTFICIFRNYG